MKKVITVLAAVVITVSAWAMHASSPVENAKVKEAFEKVFTGATDAKWAMKDDSYVVTFKLNNENMRAWFTEEGDFKGFQRNVRPNQMTFLAAKTLRELASETKITSIEEVTKDDIIYYQVRTENDNAKITYSLSATGEKMRLEKKRKK